MVSVFQDFVFIRKIIVTSATTLITIVFYLLQTASCGRRFSGVPEISLCTETFRVEGSVYPSSRLIELTGALSSKSISGVGQCRGLGFKHDRVILRCAKSDSKTKGHSEHSIG